MFRFEHLRSQPSARYVPAPGSDLLRHHVRDRPRDPRGWLAALPSTTAFLTAFGAYVGVGLACVYSMSVYPPRGAAEAQAGATCFDARHHAHHAEVSVRLGTPAREYRLLARLDASLQCGGGATSYPAMTLVASDALHSASVACTTPEVAGEHAGTDDLGDLEDLEDLEELAAERSTCFDVAMVSRWHMGDEGDPAKATQERELLPVSFSFGASQLAGSEAIDLGLDGELYLCRGFRYVLSARELCAWRDDSESACAEYGELPVERRGAGDAFNGFGALPRTLRAARGPWGDVPAASEACDDGTAGFAQIFPAHAYVQTTFLAQRASHLLNDVAAVDAEQYESFLSAIEVGGACAALLGGEVARARTTFELACSSASLIGGWSSSRHAHCVDAGALLVPYTRLSVARLDMRVGIDGRGCFRATHDRTLEHVASSNGGSASLNPGSAWLKLLCILLAAAVMWARREDSTDRTDAIFGRCVEMLLAPGRLRIYDFDAQTMLLGLIAASTRVAIAASMLEMLRYDRLGRVALVELLAGLASLAHWFVLYTGELLPPLGWIKVNGLRPALGGSSALVDACCATMLAFSTPPVRADIESFDVIARVLTAVLVVTTCVSRCLLSAACAGVLGRSGAGYAYAIAAVAMAYWVGQAASLGVVLADLVATPVSMHWTRTNTGSRTFMATLLFLAASMLAGPRLTANAVLVSQRVHASQHAAVRASEAT